MTGFLLNVSAVDIGVTFENGVHLLHEFFWNVVDGYRCDLLSGTHLLNDPRDKKRRIARVTELFVTIAFYELAY